jgi:hypothetical protein
MRTPARSVGGRFARKVKDSWLIEVAALQYQRAIQYDEYEIHRSGDTRPQARCAVPASDGRVQT